MSDPVVDKIQSNPKYLELRRKRNRFGWWLTALMMVVYYGYIALIAFDKPFLAQPIGDGVTTIGHPDRARRDRLHDPDHRPSTCAAPTANSTRSRPRSSRRPHDERAPRSRWPRCWAALPGRRRGLRGRRRPRARPPSSRPTGSRSPCSSGFVLLTLCITKWAAAKTKSAADFYTAGGGITGFQNGLAIAGDYMSAASFLGISAAVMATGYDGLIYSIGFLVGWPVITFLMAERLRNLGKFTFADVAAYRFQPDADPRLRGLRHAGGGGVLPDRADGRRRPADQAAVRAGLLDGGGDRRRADDGLRAVRRHDGHHLGADHQGRAAAGRRDLHGAMVLAASTSAPRRCSPRRSRSRPDRGQRRQAARGRGHRRSHHGPGRLHQGPDLGDLASAWR